MVTKGEYETLRANAIERIRKLAHPRTTVPLDDVAGMLPTLPEWKKFERRLKRARKAVTE